MCVLSVGYLHPVPSGPHSGTTRLRHRWDVEPRAPENQVRVSVMTLDPRGPLLAAIPASCSEEGVDTAELQCALGKTLHPVNSVAGLVSSLVTLMKFSNSYSSYRGAERWREPWNGTFCSMWG